MSPCSANEADWLPHNVGISSLLPANSAELGVS